ncbi:Jhd2p [Sugiyamaella lignohabitans]|uniref:Jhd2p n=1 Tax=Sugiyamaella lignohabitans TaxID=796027 RepID=A0A167D489_9ASCO|nr:Jhd2p [Sugiyamaella lignohabitans]ANB12459.1 Jhd2p [Sugiyamaella lignohabitans]
MCLHLGSIPGLDSVECKSQSCNISGVKKEKRPFNLEEAPVLYPTIEEFKDPYSYINSLYELGEKYGILKVVAPEKWNPKFAIDIGGFNFECRKQTLNTMGAMTRSTMGWADRMAHFHQLFGSIGSHAGSNSELSSVNKMPNKMFDEGSNEMSTEMSDIGSNVSNMNSNKRSIYMSNETSMEKYPAVGNGVLYYYHLKEIVHRLGGHKAVDDGNLWPLVCAKLELSTTADIATAQYVKSLYHTYLLPYERYVAYVESTKARKTAKVRSGSLDYQKEEANAYISEWNSKQRSRLSTPVVPSRNLITPPSSTASIITVTRGIPLEASMGNIANIGIKMSSNMSNNRNLNSDTDTVFPVDARDNKYGLSYQGGLTPVVGLMPSPEIHVKRENSSLLGNSTAGVNIAASRLPLSPPPEASSKRRLREVNTENGKDDNEGEMPISKRRQRRSTATAVNYKDTIYHHSPGSVSTSNSTSMSNSTPPPPTGRMFRSSKTRTPKQKYKEVDLEEDEDGQDDEDDEVDICPECDDEVIETTSALVCLECDCHYHDRCLSPLLAINTKVLSWYCPKCLVGTGEFYFDVGGEYDLPGFQEMANDFKNTYMETELPIVDPEDRAVVECLVEQNFWHHVNDPKCKIAVEYGADIPCDTKGSGFPSIAKDPFNRYAKHPWNLNNFPLNKMSLFRGLKSDISGVTVPWAYVGMMFSAFCWHSEDHYTYSVNYQHLGDTKTWYGIPGCHGDEFEQASKKLVPELFEKQPDILFQRATMISPETIKKMGIPVYVVDQHPGEFVITFPNAYHAGFNHGFNFNEAVNYAPPDWLVYGKAAVKSYKSQMKSPIFSHDEILIRNAATCTQPETAEWLYPQLLELLKEETENQAKLADLSSYTIDHKKRTINGCDEDSYECCICSCLCYISRLIPTDDKSKVYCYDDFQKHQGSCFELELTFTVQELQTICDNTRRYLDD